MKRNKNMLQTTFELGLTHSFSSALVCLDEISLSMKGLFLRSQGKLIPLVLKQGLVRTFNDDNINQQSSSPTATKNCNATAMSCLQFPQEPGEGISRERRSVKDINPIAPGLETVLEEYLSVVGQKVSKESHRLVQTVNVEEFDVELGVVFQKSMGEEEEFLIGVIKNIRSDAAQPVTWTSHDLCT